VSINDLTVSMAWIAGLAILALVFAGWRKTARAQPKPLRRPLDPPKRVPYEVAEPYRPAGVVRRLWAVVASSGLALVVGAVIATVTAFSLAWIVTTLTDLLKQ
jgi:ABC-type nitrate/sulfonate/bicarbonate transport system permease component